MIEGTLAIVLAFVCFAVPMAVPLFAQRWRTLIVILVLGAVFFGWLTLEMNTPGTIPASIGSFLGGLMLFGFAAGAIAKFVALVSQRPH